MAIYKYHRSHGDLSAAIDHLDESYLKNFGDGGEELGHLEELLRDYATLFGAGSNDVSEWQHFMSFDVGNDIQISGELSRLDVTPGGYAVRLFSKEPVPKWENHLRMPLIQAYWADVIGVSPEDVGVGFYLLEDRRYEARQYSLAEVNAALNEMRDLAAKIMGG